MFQGNLDVLTPYSSALFKSLENDSLSLVFQSLIKMVPSGSAFSTDDMRTAAESWTLAHDVSLRGYLVCGFTFNGAIRQLSLT